MIECVPNFSEGKRPEVIDAIANQISSKHGIALLSKEMDANHNRSVITFAGEFEPVRKAAIDATKKAAELIDLTRHTGEHPRIGATDVIPFIPLKGNTMADCVKLAREVGKEIGERLHIPIYLYEEAATKPERKNLADIRKGEFEGLRKELGTNPERTPDFGPNKIHPTAGATVVGARFFLLAYNINLNTSDIKIAKQIAKAIRESSGGMPAVKALGIFLEDEDTAQVSMNLTNYRVTGLKTVFDAVGQKAKELGTSIKESEIIGLIPAEALVGTSPQELIITDFNDKMIIENWFK
jgi:glutamate formiminotransferase